MKWGTTLTELQGNQLSFLIIGLLINFYLFICVYSGSRISNGLE